jgi:hypothetical protein
LLILSDGVDLFGWRGQLREPLWQTLLLNRRPTEWLQWSALGSVFGGAWYLAADLRARGTSPRAVRFLLWFGLGAALMLIEDAGDVRHTIAHYVRRASGDDLVLGLHPVVLVDVPYFAVLVLPLLASAHHAWGSTWRSSTGEVNGDRNR